MEAQRISAQTIKQRMKKGDYFVFIDTRNPKLGNLLTLNCRTPGVSQRRK